MDSKRFFDVRHLVGNGCAHHPVAQWASDTIILNHLGDFILL